MRHLLLSMLGAVLLSGACAEEDDDDHGALFEAAYEDATGDGKEDGGCSGVRVPDRSGFNKRVVLTFDDGPNPATTPQVIEVLKRHNAPATFFTNGSRYGSAAAVQLAADIAADPDYILANHSQSHMNLSQQTEARVIREIESTDQLIRAAGEAPRYFRFPFGAATCSAKRAAEDRGYIVTGWHIDSADWCYAAGNGTCKKSTFMYVPDEMRGDMQAYVMQQVRASNGGIVLFHDVHQSTADRLDAILTTLESEGFTFARLDDTAMLPRLHNTSAPIAKFIGDACQTNADCAFTASGAAGRCHAAGFCTITCGGSCPDATGKAPTFCIAADPTDNTGICVAKSVALNQSCALLPKTTSRVAPRFLGTSGAAPATATVCAPR